MRFTELDIFGVYISPMAAIMIAAWILLVGIRYLAGRAGMLQHAWHPALLGLAIYVALLSSITLIVAS